MRLKNSRAINSSSLIMHYCILYYKKKSYKHLQFIIMYKTMGYRLGSKRFYINEFTLKNHQKCASIRIIPSYSFTH